MTEARPQRIDPGVRPVAVHVLGVAAAIGAGGVLAYLVAGERAELAVALLLAGPLAYLLLRHPLSVMAIWLAVTPFLVATDGGVVRKVYWIVHRALPLLVLAVVVAGARVRPGGRLPRLGWPEAAMAGYVVASALSIMATADAPTAMALHLYDRVAVPMALYALVRLLPPDGRDLRRVLPVVVFLLVSQTAFGVLSWVAPDLLPSAWLGRAGLRTTGSLRHPNVYGTTLLFAGLVVLHHAFQDQRLRARRFLRLLFPVALTMVFLSYSRASWVAAVVVLVGVAVLYPRYTAGLVAAASLVVPLLFGSGLLDGQLSMARNRFYSEQSAESALSRLPVVYASLRMFEAKPLHGWGFGNFDRFSPSFQGRVGGVIVPDKEHASHNLYLTILAEQGVVGLALYLAPALWWLVASRSAWRNLPAGGLVSRKLLVVLWLVLATHVVVNNYSNMRVVFGLGIWWLTLGTIASVVTRYRAAVPTAPRPPLPAAFAGTGAGTGGVA